MSGLVEHEILQDGAVTMLQLQSFSSQSFAPLKVDCNPTQVIPVRFSANPTSIFCLPQPNTVSACLALPWQYFNVICA
jgi:hypothetical protein